MLVYTMNYEGYEGSGSEYEAMVCLGRSAPYYRLGVSDWPTFCGGHIVDLIVEREHPIYPVPHSYTNKAEAGHALWNRLPQGSFCLLTPRAHKFLMWAYKGTHLKDHVTIREYRSGNTLHYLWVKSAYINRRGWEAMIRNALPSSSLPDVRNPDPTDGACLSRWWQGYADYARKPGVAGDAMVAEWKEAIAHLRATAHEGLLKATHPEKALSHMGYGVNSNSHNSSLIGSSLWACCNMSFFTNIWTALTRVRLRDSDHYFGGNSRNFPTILGLGLTSDEVYSMLLKGIAYMLRAQGQPTVWLSDNVTSTPSTRWADGFMGGFCVGDIMTWATRQLQAGVDHIVVDKDLSIYFHIMPVCARNPNEGTKYTYVGMLSLNPISTATV